MQNKRFIDACTQYGLSVGEGTASILGCHKVGKEQDGTEIIIWRQEQGYDSE